MTVNADIFVSKEKDEYKVKVIGRATFAVAPTIRNLVQRMESDAGQNNISINLEKCTGMDSTFMGILAMLALKIRNKQQRSVQILNATEANKKLLNGLGLNKLFDYSEVQDPAPSKWIKEKEKTASLKENADTVLQAHKTLIETDIGNSEKFQKVVDQVKKEIKNL